MPPLDKTLIRKEYLSRRNALDEATRGRASSLIRQKLFQNERWRQATTVLCYVSYSSEVDTHALIQEAVRFKKRIVIPIFDPKNPDITVISELKRFGDLQPGPKNIWEPRPDAVTPVDPAQIDVALVPGIVFDHNGHRIGFGGGYFDRILSRAPQAYRIGLAFASQLYERPLLPEQHDVPMHFIQTEREGIPIS